MSTVRAEVRERTPASGAMTRGEGSLILTQGYEGIQRQRGRLCVVAGRKGRPTPTKGRRRIEGDEEKVLMTVEQEVTLEGKGGRGRTVATQAGRRCLRFREGRASRLKKRAAGVSVKKWRTRGRRTRDGMVRYVNADGCKRA